MRRRRIRQARRPYRRCGNSRLRALVREREGIRAALLSRGADYWQYPGRHRPPARGPRERGPRESGSMAVDPQALENAAARRSFAVRKGTFAGWYRRTGIVHFGLTGIAP